MSPLTSREESMSWELCPHLSSSTTFLLPLIILQWRGILPSSLFSCPPPLCGACVFVLYVHRHLYACVYRHACVLAQWSEENVGSPTTLTLPLFPWEKDSPWNWSYIGVQKSQEFLLHSELGASCMNAKDLKSSLYAWPVSVLTTWAVSAALLYPHPSADHTLLINSSSYYQLKFPWFFKKYWKFIPPPISSLNLECFLLAHCLAIF